MQAGGGGYLRNNTIQRGSNFIILELRFLFFVLFVPIPYRPYYCIYYVYGLYIVTYTMYRNVHHYLCLENLLRQRRTFDRLRMNQFVSDMTIVKLTLHTSSSNVGTLVY